MNKKVAEAILNREIDKEFVGKHFGGPGSGRFPSGSGNQSLPTKGSYSAGDKVGVNGLTGPTHTILEGNSKRGYIVRSHSTGNIHGMEHSRISSYHGKE